MITRRLLIAMAGILCLSVTSMGQVPEEISYQGLLTDAAGDPVADGDYNVEFSLWDDDNLGNQEWSSGIQPITAENGLFSYSLGSNTVFPVGLWRDHSELWLQIQVSGDPPIAPRTKLSSTPYAHRAEIVGPELHLGDQTTPGEIRLQRAGTSSHGLRLFGDLFAADFGGAIQFFDETGFQYSAIEPLADGAGFFKIARSPGQTSFSVNANFAGTDAPRMSLTGNNSANDIIFDPSNPSSDDKAQFPDNAVHSQELLNEPGLASQQNNPSLTLTTALQDLETVTIDIPAAGYIVVLGKAYFRVSGSTSGNYVTFKINENPSIPGSIPYINRVGLSAYPTTGLTYHNGFVHRVFFKGSAGSYTFRLEAEKSTATHTINAYSAMLTAVYLPTSYGSVSTLLAQPGEFSESKLVTAKNPNDPDQGPDMYKVDLRELEIRAQQARIEALEAERELREARERAQLEQVHAE